MGEALASGSAAVEVAGAYLGVGMADWWQADSGFFELIRDREILVSMVAEMAGTAVAEQNKEAKGKALKAILGDCLDGANGRAKVDHWVPKWMTFPPSAYTARGGVGPVRAAALVASARRPAAPDPEAVEESVILDEETRLAA